MSRFFIVMLGCVRLHIIVLSVVYTGCHVFIVMLSYFMLNIVMLGAVYSGSYVFSL